MGSIKHLPLHTSQGPTPRGSRTPGVWGEPARGGGVAGGVWHTPAKTEPKLPPEEEEHACFWGLNGETEDGWMNHPLFLSKRI